MEHSARNLDHMDTPESGDSTHQDTLVRGIHACTCKRINAYTTDGGGRLGTEEEGWIPESFFFWLTASLLSMSAEGGGSSSN